MSAYFKNIRAQNAEIVGSNTLAQAVLKFMDDRSAWTGTVHDAFTALHEIADPALNDKSFPKAANKLRNHLNKIRTNLMEYGITYLLEGFHTKRGNLITFEKITEYAGEDTDTDTSIFTLPSPCKVNDTNGCEHGEHSEDKNAYLRDTCDDGFVHEPEESM